MLILITDFYKKKKSGDLNRGDLNQPTLPLIRKSECAVVIL